MECGTSADSMIPSCNPCVFIVFIESIDCFRISLEGVPMALALANLSSFLGSSALRRKFEIQVHATKSMRLCGKNRSSFLSRFREERGQNPCRMRDNTMN